MRTIAATRAAPARPPHLAPATLMLVRRRHVDYGMATTTRCRLP